MVLVAASGPARAQLVNIEKERRAEGTEGTSRRLNLSVAVRSGNVDLVDLGLGLRLERWNESTATLLLSRGRFAERSGDTFVQEALVHLRHNFRRDRRVDPEIYTQYQTNEFALLDSRVLVGGGIRSRLDSGDRTSAYVGLGAMYDYESLDVDPSGEEDPSSSVARLNGYVSYGYALDRRVILNNTLFIQPRVDDPGDLRILEEATMTVEITTAVSLQVTFRLNHDSRPPSTVESTDLELRNSLVFNW